MTKFSMTENFGKDSGSSGYSEGEHPLQERVAVHSESQEASVGQMDIDVKISILHMQNRKSHAFF